jgi:hypothetical protein
MRSSLSISELWSFYKSLSNQWNRELGKQTTGISSDKFFLVQSQFWIMDTPRSSCPPPTKTTVFSLEPFDPILFSAMSTLGSIAALPPFYQGCWSPPTHTPPRPLSCRQGISMPATTAPCAAITASIRRPLPQVFTSATATTVLWPSLKGAPPPLSSRHLELASTWALHPHHFHSPPVAPLSPHDIEGPIRRPERGEWMGADKNSSRRRLKLRQDEPARSDPQNHTLRTSTFRLPKPRSHWSATGLGTNTTSKLNTHAPTTAETTRKPTVQRGRLDRV